MNTNKLLKIWALITIVLIGVIIYLYATKTVVVNPEIPVTVTTPEMIYKKLDSLQNQIAASRAMAGERTKILTELQKKQNEIEERRRLIQRQIDSLDSSADDAHKLLRELSNTAQTRWSK